MSSILTTFNIFFCPLFTVVHHTPKLLACSHYCIYNLKNQNRLTPVQGGRDFKTVARLIMANQMLNVYVFCVPHNETSHLTHFSL
ncbi:hypothetical protein F5880DRAFT_1531035, partial [Lentinula raphanica]